MKKINHFLRVLFIIQICGASLYALTRITYLWDYLTPVRHIFGNPSTSSLYGITIDYIHPDNWILIDNPWLRIYLIVGILLDWALVIGSRYYMIRGRRLGLYLFLIFQLSAILTDFPQIVFMVIFLLLFFLKNEEGHSLWKIMLSKEIQSKVRKGEIIYK